MDIIHKTLIYHQMDIDMLIIAKLPNTNKKEKHWIVDSKNPSRPLLPGPFTRKVANNILNSLIEKYNGLKDDPLLTDEKREDRMKQMIFDIATAGLNEEDRLLRKNDTQLKECIDLIIAALM